ncbi:hypothetical protein LOY97_006829, partial [Ophidiomyces ophidiicola]
MAHHYSDDAPPYAYTPRSAPYGLAPPPPAYHHHQPYAHPLLSPYTQHQHHQPSVEPALYPPSPTPAAALAAAAYPYPTAAAYAPTPTAAAAAARPARFHFHDSLRAVDIESQESFNEHSMLSEPVMPPLDGFPDVREFDQLMKSYVDDLSVKKQDKALIHSRRARNIRTVLLDPKDTAIESAQFRFWVKKMFKLDPNDGRTIETKRMICHEGKPVAIREKLFKILTRAHQQCQHGGRDKTSAQVRRIYSWVPKELISRFVKICPTCQVRRGGSRLTPPNSCRTSPKLELLAHHHHHQHQHQHAAVAAPASLLSPPDSRRESIISRPGVPYSRAELPQPPSMSSWAAAAAAVDPNNHHTSPTTTTTATTTAQQQYHGHYTTMPAAAAAAATAPAWAASLPRSMSATMHAGTSSGTTTTTTTAAPNISSSSSSGAGHGSLGLPSHHLEYDSYD